MEENLRKRASAWETADLLEEMIINHHGLMNCQKRMLRTIPSACNIFAAEYAEVLHRMGMQEKQIAEMLRNHPLLHFKNGQEQHFVFESEETEYRKIILQFHYDSWRSIYKRELSKKRKKDFLEYSTIDARKSFSRYVGLEKIIPFDDMLELERECFCNSKSEY